MRNLPIDAIEVKYVCGNTTTVSDKRWLLTGTGDIVDEDGKVTNHGFRPLANGAYSNCQGNVVRAVSDGGGCLCTPDIQERCLSCNLQGKGEDRTTEPATTYPDGNPKSVQGAKKHSLRLIPLPALVAINEAMQDGLTKYGPANWRETGVACTVYIDAALRHIFEYFDGGVDLASDSKAKHLGHAMACLAIIVDAAHNGTLIDDRPKPCKDVEALLKRADK